MKGKDEEAAVSSYSEWVKNFVLRSFAVEETEILLVILFFNEKQTLFIEAFVPQAAQKTSHTNFYALTGYKK